MTDTFDYGAAAGKKDEQQDVPVFTPDTSAPAPKPAATSFDFEAAAGRRTKPPEPTTSDGLFYFGVTAESPPEEVGPRQEITDPLGRPLKEQPPAVPPRQWNVFGGPLVGSKAEEWGARIDRRSLAVLQNLTLTEDIPANRAALIKMVRDVYEKSGGVPVFNGADGADVFPRAARIPVDDLTDDQLARALEHPGLVRALELDSVTRKRMAENVEEAAILRGEIDPVLAAEGQVDTMMRMLLPKLTPEAIIAQRDRGFIRGVSNMLSLGVAELLQGFGLSSTGVDAAVARAARTTPWDTAVGTFTAVAFPPGGISANTFIPYIWTPLDLANGVSAAVTKVARVYYAGGFNTETADTLGADSLMEAAAILKVMRKTAAELPSGEAASDFMRKAMEADSDFAVLRLVYEDPAGFFAAAAEMFARNAPILGASAAATRLFGARAGMTVGTFGQFQAENLRADEERFAFLKKKTGIDLNTPVGVQLFMRDPDAQRLWVTYGRERGAAIAGVQLATLGYLRGGTFFKARSLTLQLAERTTFNTVFEGVGEGFAGFQATGELDIRQAVLESTLSAGMGVPTTLIEGYTAGAHDAKRAADARKAEQWLKGATNLKGLIAGIPLVKLDTVASVLGEKLASEGVDTVYIAAGPLFEQGAETAQTLGLDPEDVKRLAAEGGAVEVSAATFVRHILGKDGFDALIEHTAFEANGMTPSEAREYVDAGIGDQIQQQLEERTRNKLAPNLDDASLTKLNTDMAQIQDQVAGQLEATGKYDANKSRLFGLLTAQRYATRAIRMTEETGRPVDAAALFEADNLQILGGQPAATTPTREAAPEGQIAVFDSEGNQQNLEVVARSEAGGVIVRLPNGEELLLGSELEVSDPLSSDFVVEGLPNAPRISDLSDPELASLEANRLERIAAFEAEGATGQGGYEQAKRDLTAARSEMGRRRPSSDDNILYQDAPDGALEQARATVQDPASLGLTEEEAARVNPIYRAGALPTRRLASNENAAKWLEAQFEGDAITDFTATLSTEQLDQLGRMMAAEVQLALESTGNAADWYSGAVLKAITTASIKYPMLTDDAAAEAAGFGTSSNARFAFTYIMAVTSQNLDVSKNSAAADAAFSEMVEMVKAGDYSMKGAWGTGDKQAAMAKNFKKFKPMLAAMDGATPQEKLANLDALFRQKKTVKEWVVDMKAAGIPYSPPGNTAMDVVVYGSSTLGPKIGNGFWQNLNGNFDPLTIDLWMRRTWGRLTGKSIGLPSAIPAQRRRLKAAVAKSRSKKQGSADLIDIARAELDTALAAQADHTGQAETTNQTKKDFDAETRRLNKVVRDGEALLSDLAGLKAPEVWKAEYGRTDAALLAYSKRLLKAWAVEYKSLQKKYDKGSIPDELQPTWARAAKAIRANLATPLDQITNGTQRKQVEAAGARAIEILSERGTDVTTADMQALLWYPEKELWGALRDRLEVDDNGVPIVTASALNESYDTAFARIFRSQGYEVEGIAGDGAGGSGQRAVAGQDARLVEPGDIRGAGQVGSEPAGEGRELFQEVDFVGDVIFEVAPDPNNVELSARWNALPPAAQLAISDTVSKSVLPSVLEAAGAEGSVSPQIGSYQDDTNPSFSLRLTSGDPAAVANAVGFVLSQDSMVALSADAFEGSFEAGAVRIQIGDKSLQEIDAIYQTLRGIEGFPPIGGQSTIEGQMTLILAEGVDPRSFADAVDVALASEYAVKAARLQAAFPEKKDYDYASDRNDPAGSAGVARQRYRDVRVQASRELAAAIDQYERGGTTAFEQQRGAAGPRGGFTPSDLINDQDGDPVNLLQIFEKADATTFLHESGHFWLEQLKGDALAVGGRFQRDFKVVTDWWASRPLELREEAVRRAKKDKDKDSVAALQQMTEAQVSAYARSGELRGSGPSRYLSVAMHEQFARGVENYFATGRAPSLSLAAAFSAFKVWVMSVYTKLAGSKLDVQFSAEVTAVVDRMLASDEEIAMIEGQYKLAALYSTAEQAGMTPTQFAAYQKQIAEAKDDRRASQLAKHIKELRRERTAWWKEERETLRGEASQEVAAEPAYRLLYALTNQGLADGSTLPEGEAVNRMDRATLKEILESEGFSLADIPRVDSKAVYEEGGLSPGVVAQAFGYDDVDAMILDLVGRQPYGQAVEQAIDAKMEEEHGSIEGGGEAAALASAHSERTARVLAAELTALRTSEPAFKQAFVRAYARDRLLEMPSGQVRPYRFLAAEKRHADLAGDALKRGDRVSAYRHQFQRLVNHYMAAEALKAQAAIEKKSRYMRKFTKKGKKFPSIEAEYVDNILRILAAVNFGRGAAGKQSRANEIIALQEFIVEREKADGSILDVPDWLVNPTGDTANTVSEISYRQFINLHDTIKRYEQQGRAANKVRRGDDELSRAESKAELLAVLDGMKQSRVSRLRGKAASPDSLRIDDRIRYSAAAGAALFDAQLLKVEFLLESLDGRALGPWHQTIYEPFNKAAADKYILQEEVSKLIGALIADLPTEVRRSFGKPVDVGDLGKPGMRFNRGNLIMMAINVGNESNLDKFIRGMAGDVKTKVKGAGWNVNEELIDAALDNLTEQEWNLVRAVWKHAEKLYPTVEGIYRREHGISPDRVEPRTVTTKFGDITGGYFPMMYDRTIAGVAVDLQQKTALELMQGDTGRASINSSMTKARTGYAAPVDLDISRMATGFDNTIHFITHYEAVRNANKILGDRDIRAELENKVGIAYTDELTKWVAALASNGNDSPPVGWWQKAIQHIYTNTTVAVLGFSYSTLAMQTLGLFNGQDRLLADSGYGPAGIVVAQKDIAAGVAAAFSPSHVQFVISISGEMRGRRKSMDREVSNVLKRLSSKEGPVTSVQRFSMQAIAEVQFYTVDIPVWTAGYNRALRGIVEGVAKGDTDAAIKYADRVVRLSQSSGGLKDLSAIQRQKGVVKGLTMFYTFFSALYAVLRSVGVEFSQNVMSTPVASTSRAATRLFVLLALQSLASGLIRGDLPDWDEKDEKKQDMLDWIAKDAVATALGTIPVVRDIASGLASGYGYSGGAGTIGFDAASKSLAGLEKVIDEFGNEEPDAQYADIARRYAKYVLLAGAITGRVPAVQLNRTFSGLAAMYDEADNWRWHDLVRGYKKDRSARRED